MSAGFYGNSADSNRFQPESNQYQTWPYLSKGAGTDRRAATKQYMARTSINNISNLAAYLKPSTPVSTTKPADEPAPPSSAALSNSTSFDNLIVPEPKQSRIKAMQPKSSQPNNAQNGIMIPYETFYISAINCTTGNSHWSEHAIRIEMECEEEKFDILDSDIETIEYDLSGNGDKIVKIILKGQRTALMEITKHQTLVNLRFADKYKTDIEFAIRKLDVHTMK